MSQVDATAPPSPEPHFAGHRERLRERFRRGGVAALNDYELLELILFRAMPRRDVKPIAKALLTRFGSFAEVLAARPERLDEIAGLGEAAVTELKIVEAAARRLALSTIEKRSNLGSSSAVLEYCRTAMAFIDREEFPLSWCLRLIAKRGEQTSGKRDERGGRSGDAMASCPRKGFRLRGGWRSQVTLDVRLA